VILPKHNEADLDDVPQTVREQMTFILVDTVDEVLAAALDEPIAEFAELQGDHTKISPNGLGSTPLKNGSDNKVSDQAGDKITDKGSDKVDKKVVKRPAKKVDKPVKH
jgi:hypothetical protein